MNKAILMGRLTKAPELRTTSNGTEVCNWTLAIDRNYKNADGTRTTDFIPCVAWRNTASFVAKFFSKGERMAVIGTIQPRSWETERGETRYITEVICDEVYFADGKAKKERVTEPEENDSFDFASDDTSLPFDL